MGFHYSPATLRERLLAGAFLLFGVVLFAGKPAFAQEDVAPARLESIPVDEWVAAGERKQIQWRVSTWGPQLSFHQRLHVLVSVTVDGGALQKTGVEHELHLLVKLATPAGQWLPGEAWRAARISRELPRRTDLQFGASMFLAPGEYSLVVVLYDSVTGRRSLAKRKLRVSAPRNDPLLEASSRLPTVEFLSTEEGALPDTNRRRPRRGEEIPATTDVSAASRLEAGEISFQPKLRGELELPVRTQRRVHVEILANFSATERYSGSRVVMTRNFGVLLPTLKIFSGLDLSNGSLTFTALDLDRQRVFFQQQNVRALDWPRLRESLATLRTDVVDVRELQARQQRAAFFREVLERRVNASPLPAAAGNGPAPQGEPFRVFIVLGQGILFPRGSDLKPMAVEGDCNCRVYYLQYRLTLSDLWDELGRVMKPLEPKRFQIDDPMDMRKAIAAILEDLREM